MDKVVYGENCIYSTDCLETGLNNNAIISGPSGSGKTMSITESCLLETYERSLVVTVTKRRIVNKYTALLKKRGYEVQDLDFVHPDKGDIGYDPLRQVKSYQDITFLAESIVKSNPRKERSNADPYWDDTAISLLSAEIAYTLMSKKHPSFSDVLDMHDRLNFKEDGGQISTSYDDEFAALAKKDPTCFAVTCWKSFSMTPIKTASCIFGALNTAIDTIFSPDLRKMMSMSRQVDFKDLGRRKTVLFVTTSPVNPALHCFVNMFYGHIFKQLFEFAENQPNGTLPVPVHVIADDFATGSRILNFAEYISIFREKKISATLLLQSESQLESMYGTDDATTIINNCDTYVYMGGMDIKTAHHISVRLNMPIDDVLYMPLGQIVMFRRGQRPVITQRYNILENELYQQVTKEYESTMEDQSR